MVATTLPPLIQQMHSPAFYPHGTTEPIRLIQTHVSYVLLTGDYAYKVKKAVNFGFLDYSTLAKRHHFCEEELRLNQRCAAPLYLEVVPLTQTDTGQFEMGGDGDVVEYAVKMRQFPQDALLTSLYEAGQLTEELIRDLASVVADFHQQAETNAHIQSFGEVDQIRAAFDENYAQTVGFIGGPQTQKQFDETKAYTDRFFAERTTLFQARIQQGKIRACHGDLHLGNICYWQDRLWLFDCIEFNEPFRLVDVMYDVGFVVMDLQAKQRPDLAAIFISEYTEQTGDWDGLKLLPLYVSRQAYVRAKVTSFLLNDPSVSATDREKATAAAAPYYHLAWSAVQSKDGQLLVMAGLSGSGKSTTARELMRQLGAIHLRSDAVRKHLAGVPLSQRGDDSLYTPEMTQKTYGRLLELGIQLAQVGFPVVLDAKYDRQALRQAILHQAQQQNIPLKIIHCTAPMDVLKSRLNQREGDIADATVAILQKQVMEDFTPTEKKFVSLVDTTKALSSQVASIVKDIQ